jgi:nicotinic acid mononucleotide adenylyltransferase
MSTLTTILFTTLPALKRDMRGMKNFRVEVAGEKNVSSIKIGKAEAIELMAESNRDFVLSVYRYEKDGQSYTLATVRSANGEYSNDE